MRKNRLIIVILISVIILFSYKCVDRDLTYSFKLKNNSGNLIFYWVSYNYPDTSLALEKEITGGLNPGDFRFIDSKTPWPQRIDEIPGDTLLIFIFDPDTLETYPWNEVRDDYKILKRIELGPYDTPPLDQAVNYP